MRRADQCVPSAPRGPLPAGRGPAVRVQARHPACRVPRDLFRWPLRSWAWPSVPWEVFLADNICVQENRPHV